MKRRTLGKGKDGSVHPPGDCCHSPLHRSPGTGGEVYDGSTLEGEYVTRYINYPRQTLEIKCQRDGIHPTQKPMDLFEYLIRTYTNPGEVVADCCAGSGTTAVAAIRVGRDYVCFDIDKGYCETAEERAANAEKKP